MKRELGIARCGLLLPRAYCLTRDSVFNCRR